MTVYIFLHAQPRIVKKAIIFKLAKILAKFGKLLRKLKEVKQATTLQHQFELGIFCIPYYLFLFRDS